MKKIFVLNGSRRKNGNTIKFIKNIMNYVDNELFEIEYAFPQDFKIKPCSGCHQCFIDTRCSVKDDLNLIQEKILSADVFIIASPVYMHYMTADLKFILDKLSYWAHIFKLQGKPVVVISTCSTNGHNSVIDPLSNMMKLMGGNVIASANAAQIPNQIRNETWLAKVSKEISSRIQKYAFLPIQSTTYLDNIFKITKSSILEQEQASTEYGFVAGEVEYWKETGMLKCNTFSEYLNKKNNSEII